KRAGFGGRLPVLNPGWALTNCSVIIMLEMCRFVWGFTVTKCVLRAGHRDSLGLHHQDTHRR
ncbi:hypothetical protein LEMLEM_LOCUS13611, partial [Lemmus lemmus]